MLGRLNHVGFCLNCLCNFKLLVVGAHVLGLRRRVTNLVAVAGAVLSVSSLVDREFLVAFERLQMVLHLRGNVYLNASLVVVALLMAHLDIGLHA